MEIDDLQSGYVKFKDIKHLYDELVHKNKKSFRFSDTYESLNFNISITQKPNPKRINVTISCDHGWCGFFTLTTKKLVDNVSLKIYNPYEDREMKMYVSNFSMLNADQYTNTKVLLSMLWGQI